MCRITRARSIGITQGRKAFVHDTDVQHLGCGSGVAFNCFDASMQPFNVVANQKEKSTT